MPPEWSITVVDGQIVVGAKPGKSALGKYVHARRESVGVVKRCRIDADLVRRLFAMKREITPATLAKVSPGLLRRRVRPTLALDPGESSARKCHPRHGRSTGVALTHPAMTIAAIERLSGNPEAHLAAKAPAFMTRHRYLLLGHGLESRWATIRISRKVPGVISSLTPTAVQVG